MPPAPQRPSPPRTATTHEAATPQSPRDLTLPPSPASPVARTCFASPVSPFSPASPCMGACCTSPLTADRRRARPDHDSPQRVVRSARQRVAVQALEAEQLATLRADIARAETFSLLYVPFIHAVLRSSLYSTQIAAIRSLSPQHRFNWDQMVALYRRRIEEAPDDVAATLSATNVQQVNMSFKILMASHADFAQHKKQFLSSHLKS